MNKKTSAALLYSLAVFLIIYCVFTVVMGLVREGADTLLDAFVCILACVVTCAIIRFACKNAVDETPNPRKRPKKRAEEITIVKFSSSAIALFCVITAVACVFYGLGIAGIVKLYGGDYVKTTANLIGDKHSLYYEYFAYGKKFYESAHISFFGIYLPENSTAEIFINANDPQIIKTVTDAILFFVLGTFFALTVLLCILVNKNKKLHIPLIVALLFLDVSVGLGVMFAVMFGLNVISLVASGALVYCLSIFFLFGTYFLIGYFCGLIKSFRGI